MAGGHLQTFIKKYMVRGSVWKAFQAFASGQPPKEKFLIILVKGSDFVFYLMPTSKGSYFQRVKDCSFVRVPAGTYSFFPLETFIGCDQLYADKDERFRSLFEKKKIEYLGQLLLDPSLVAEIERQLKSSKRLSSQEKRRLFPG